MRSAHLADACIEWQKWKLAVVDDITCSVGGSLAIQAQFTEKIAYPKNCARTQAGYSFAKAQEGRTSVFKLKIRNAQSWNFEKLSYFLRLIET